MKQFLRYQISGMVFVGWSMILFYTNQCLGSFSETIICIGKSDLSVVGGLLSAAPIGVIIHQFSVLLKNWVFARFIPQLSDSPKGMNIVGLKNNVQQEYTKYVLEKLSNLNTFFYVRFDNGLLAPGLALIFSYWVFQLNWIYIDLVVLAMFLVGVITFSYAYRISSELKIYLNMLDLEVEKTTEASWRQD